MSCLDDKRISSKVVGCHFGFDPMGVVAQIDAA